MMKCGVPPTEMVLIVRWARRSSIATSPLLSATKAKLPSLLMATACGEAFSCQDLAQNPRGLTCIYENMDGTIGK